MQKALIILAIFVAHTLSAADDRQTVAGHIPASVPKLQPIGLLDPSQRLHLVIGLPSHDEPGLDAFIQNLYDPKSPDYHHYLSPEQFTARFGPAEQDYQSLIAFAQASQGHYDNRVILDVEGAVADIEKALHVTLRTYAHPTEGRTFYAPDREPSLPSNLAVSHIAGLDNYTFPHRSQRLRPGDGSAAPKSPSPKVGTAPGGNLWGNDFRAAYVPGVSLTGSGQNLGLVEFDGYYPVDITNYLTGIGLDPAHGPQRIIVPVKGGVVKIPYAFNSEVAGDIEVAVSMAPGLNAIYVFEEALPPNTIYGAAYLNGYFDDVLEVMVTYTNILQFSCSWSGSTAKDPAAEALFKQMAAQGQSFFSASGDYGATVGAAEFPSDSPSITVVGGTTLVDGSGPDYAWVSESVWAWSNGPTASLETAVSSAGGISTYYGIPSWQTNIDMMAAQGSTIWRNYPDISANADHVYLCINNGQTLDWGGTSFATPLWAGLTALINEQAATYHEPPVGFLNPALYALAAGPNYTNCFHDVISGNNTWTNSQTLFYAVPGYDLCCGLGSPIGANLINALAPPLVLTVGVVGTNLVIAYLAQAGAIYQLQSTTNLSSSSWQAVGGPVNGAGSLVLATNRLQTSAQQFFRLFVTP